jgi:hypothetical protein
MVKAIDTFESNGEAAIDSLKSYNVTGAWATGTSYNVKDVAEESGVQYLCLEDHVSGTFATDLAAKKWTVFVLDFSSAPLNVLGSVSSDEFIITEKGTANISTAGWYKIAVWDGIERGGATIILSAIGGTYTPVTYVIQAYKDFAANATLKLEQYSDSTFITKVRIRRDDNDPNNYYYLEIYATQNIDLEVYKNSLIGYMNNISVYTGALPLGITSGAILEELDFILSGTSTQKSYIRDNLGIGTTSPQQKLHVSGGNIGIDNQQKLILNQGTGANNYLYCPEIAASRLGIFTANVERMSIDYASGRVGIETTNPLSKLMISDTGPDSLLLHRNFIVNPGIPGTSAASYLGFSVLNTSSVVEQRARIEGVGLNTNGGRLQFTTADESNTLVERLRIDQNGKVGIGTASTSTASPQALLDVAGTSRSSVNSSTVWEISDVNDFPTPSGGVISLEANTTYIIRGVVDLGTNRLSITQEGIKLMGFSLERDTLTTDTTGALITTQNVSLEIVGLTLTATNSSSTILTATNYTAGQYNNGRDKDLIIQNCQIRDCYNVWDIDGYDLVDCQNVRIRYVKATTHGYKFRSTSKVQITSCELIRWFDETSIPTPSGYATVPMLELDDNAGQSGFGAVNITGCVIHPQQTQDGIYIHPNSTTGFGTISSNTFVTIGLTTGTIFNPTPASGGYSLTSTNKYDIFVNQGLRDSEASILVTATNNTTDTALSLNTPTAINLNNTAITRNSLRLTSDGNAVITNNGTKEVYTVLTATIDYEHPGNQTTSYNFYFYKDSGSGFTVLPGSIKSLVDVPAGQTGNFILNYADTFEPNSKYAVYVENITNNNNDMRIVDIQFLVKE